MRQANIGLLSVAKTLAISRMRDEWQMLLCFDLNELINVMSHESVLLYRIIPCFKQMPRSSLISLSSEILPRYLIPYPASWFVVSASFVVASSSVA